VAIVATVVGSAPAAAETSGQADAKVQQILAKVKVIVAQVARAERAYDAALGGVAGSVNAAILDGQASDQMASQAQAARDQMNDRVRGLYMSGGPLALYATLLDAQNPTELQEQAIEVNQVVSADRVMVAAATDVSQQAAQIADDAQRQARARIRTERSVAVVATRVLTLLAQEQALLADAQSHAAAVRAAEQALAAQRAAMSTITSDQLARLHALPASPSYMEIYHRAAAAECPGLSWTVLAAIGQVESGHGRDTSTSYAGAMGPMQFLPETFIRYAVDGDGDGNADIMSAPDAIYTAANYLCANGAGGGPDQLYNAIWHYNHADWYVQMVLTLAKQYGG
jgi:soluble lytic murein transglycosylase-like protein